MQPTSLFYFDHNTAHSLRFFLSFFLSLARSVWISLLSWCPVKMDTVFLCLSVVLWISQDTVPFSLIFCFTHTQKLSLTPLRILICFHIFVLLLFVKRVDISSCILQQCQFAWSLLSFGHLATRRLHLLAAQSQNNK